MATATLSGDLITDAIRATATEGDGLSSDSSVGIYPARTNLAQNGGFAFDTRFWSITNGTLRRDTTHVKFGTYAGLVTIGSAVDYVVIANVGCVGSPVAADVYSWSAWLWVPPALDGASAQVFLFETGGASPDAIAGGVVNSPTLATGWNQLRATAAVAESDRTLVAGRIIVLGTSDGQQVWVDGGQIERSPIATPYVEAGQALPEYIPAVDLATNGTFETNTTGWTPSNGTFVADAAHAKTGTNAGKFTCTSVAGQRFVLDALSITGAPVNPATTYTVGAWIYAEAAQVGQRAQLQINGFGGATGQAAIAGTAVTTLELGWNYFLVSGSADQADRTALYVYVFMQDIAVGESLWIDTERIGTDYAAPDAITATAAAGRVRVPATRLSTRQGWLALRLRPRWATGTAAATRPTMPVTVFRWADDADNLLDVSYDGGGFVGRRISAGVAESVRWGAVLASGVAVTVVVGWGAGGLALSVDGSAFVGGYADPFMADTFTRADTVTGLGTTETGGLAWGASGASLPRIASNRFTGTDVNGFSYGQLVFADAPARISGLTSLEAAGGAVGSCNMTLISSSVDNNITDIVHLTTSPTGWTLHIREANGAFDPIANDALADTLAQDGTAYPLAAAYDGDVCVVELQDGNTYAVQDSRIATLAGRFCIWERATGDPRSRWDSVTAQVRHAAYAGGGHVPVIAATTADIGSDGAGGGQFSGDVLWYAAGRNVLTDTDATAIAALGDTDPSSKAIGTGKRLPLVAWAAATDALWTYDNVRQMRRFLGRA